MSHMPELPRGLEALPGVVRARVDWPEIDGPAVLEITLDAGSDRPEVTAQILATLRDVAGVDLESVTAVAPVPSGQPRQRGAASPAARDSRGRPAFEALRVERTATGVWVEVGLEWQGQTVTGTASSLATDHDSLRAVAEATVDALGEVLPGDVAVRIEWVEPGRLGAQWVITVGATIVGPEHQELVLGSALVRHDRWDAGVRASLDALNRQLGRPGAGGAPGVAASAAPTG